jgi:hypothetical protein
MPVGADFLVELRGFEPLTSSIAAPARLTAQPLPVVRGLLPKARRWMSPGPALLQSPYARPEPRKSRRSRRESRVTRRGLIPARNHIHIKRVDLNAMTNGLGLLGDEGRARAEEWVDDGVAAVGEVEKRIFEKANRPPRFARDRGVWVK